jgi:hypothetical protein
MHVKFSDSHVGIPEVYGEDTTGVMQVSAHANERDRSGMSVNAALLNMTKVRYKN